MSPAYPPLDPEERDWTALGMQASSAELAAYRDELARSPDDVRLRTIVAAWAAPRAAFGGTGAEALEHLEWFAAHRSASRSMLVLCAALGHVSAPDVRARADALLNALVERTSSATVVGNVAHYFQLVDPERARGLLEHAKKLEPHLAAQWAERIGQLGAHDVLNMRGHAATERAIGRPLPRDTRKLSDDDLEALERRLFKTPDDLVARATLISAYAVRNLSALQESVPEAAKLRDRVVSHLGWLIDNAPGSRETSDVGGHFMQRMDSDGYADLSARWDRALGMHADDARVHANAARFYALNDPVRALQLLERAAELDPDEPEWNRRIAQQIELQASHDDPEEVRLERARHIYEELERAAAHAVRAEEGSVRQRVSTAFNLPNLARAALAAGWTARAEDIGRQLLALAPQLPPQAGCAHEANLVLGLAALHQGDVVTASEHLRAAASEPFPFRAGRKKRMQLAQKLYDAGQRDAVRVYLEADLQDAEQVARQVGENDAPVESFSGRREIISWLEAMREGRRPDFPTQAI